MESTILQGKLLGVHVYLLLFSLYDGMLCLLWNMNRPYAYDVIISLRPHSVDIHVGLRINAVSDVPAADHKHVQGNGFCPQHGGAMMSMRKVYKFNLI